ncbi:MAG: hypothetical protein P0111_07125 [Nitrospira sp.]|nr:hypothetical protein [Nitrospira sp.]
MLGKLEDIRRGSSPHHLLEARCITNEAPLNGINRSHRDALCADPLDQGANNGTLELIARQQIRWVSQDRSDQCVWSFERVSKSKEYGAESLATGGWDMYLQLLEACLMQKEVLVRIDRTQEPFVTKNRQSLRS